MWFVINFIIEHHIRNADQWKKSSSARQRNKLGLNDSFLKNRVYKLNKSEIGSNVDTSNPLRRV